MAKKKGKKLIFILVPVVLIGVVVGLAFAGIINIPGLSPKAKKKVEAKKDDKKAAKPVAKTPTPPKPADTPTTAKPVVTTDPEKGNAKLATLWNELDTAKLKSIIEGMKDPELVPVLVKMDDEAVTNLLATLEPKRAAALSQAIRAEASKTAPKSDDF